MDRLVIHGDELAWFVVGRTPERFARLAESWDYFREITDEEVERSGWFACTPVDDATRPVALLWIARCPDKPDLDLDEETLAVCGIVDPALRGRMGASVLPDVERIGAMLGARRLLSYFEGCEALGLRVAVLCRWLRSHGWREHGLGMIREIGG